MRKNFLLFLILNAAGFSLLAQSKLGLKFSPSISSNRVSLVDSLYDAESIKTPFKFSAGLIFDYEITETYFFSTGVVFVPKYIGVRVKDDPDGQFDPTLPNPQSQDYRVNYLQLPTTLKLFTNEIQPDTKIYFQVGGALEFKIFNEPLEETYNLVEKFYPVDASVLLGGGVEYRAGVNTTLFGGITYQRGLVNTIRETTVDFQENEGLYIRNSYLSLDVGIKF